MNFMQSLGTKTILLHFFFFVRGASLNTQLNFYVGRSQFYFLISNPIILFERGASKYTECALSHS